MPSWRLLLVVLLCASAFLFHITNSYGRSRNDHNDQVRNRDHIDQILLKNLPENDDDIKTKIVREHRVLRQLREIYHQQIKPIEHQFHYTDLRRHIMTDADIHSKPIVLMVGPWSSGKSTIINYILGIEDTMEELYVGAEPTTADFTVLTYGDEYRTAEGIVLATDSTKPFSSMEKFGQIFLEHLLGIEIPNKILKNVTFIDTPGILENRRQQERGYPYNAVLRWLVMRADLIFVVFDPTKLDVGTELEALFKVVKGKESALRIILNKADSLDEQELMRVYGALFWSLSPLINVTEPPKIYVGSFWNAPYRSPQLEPLLLREEKSLLIDMREMIRNQVHNKIAFIRQHAIRVRIHALLVDSYVAAYRRNKGIFDGADDLAANIVENPENFNVFKTILQHPNISEYDLPEPNEYKEFFQINPLSDFKRVSEACSWTRGNCPFDKLNKAIALDLPNMLKQYQNDLGEHHCFIRGGHCNANEEEEESTPNGEPEETTQSGHNKWKKKKVAPAAAEKPKPVPAREPLPTKKTPKPVNIPEPAPSAKPKQEPPRKETVKTKSPKESLKKQQTQPKVVASATDFKAAGFEEEKKGFEEPVIEDHGSDKDIDVTGFQEPPSVGFEGVSSAEEAEEEPERETDEPPAEVSEEPVEESEEQGEAEGEGESEEEGEEVDQEAQEPESSAEEEEEQEPSHEDEEEEEEEAPETLAAETVAVKTPTRDIPPPKPSKHRPTTHRAERVEDDSERRPTRTGKEQREPEPEHEEKMELNEKFDCKYRKSCYSTGIVPDLDELRDASLKALTQPKIEDDEQEEPTEGTAFKAYCRYRTSCYETGEQPDLSKMPVPVPIFKHEDDSSEEDEDVSPHALHFRCRYRKSCYETGELPDIAALKAAAGSITSQEDSIEEDFSEISSELQKKFRCRYRKSCYESGHVPDLSKMEASTPKPQPKDSHVPKPAISDEKQQQRLQCKYRSSCYTTGELPDLAALRVEAAEALKRGPSKTEQDSDESPHLDEHRAFLAIKLRCRYRESCYETGELPDIAALSKDAAEALKRGPTEKDHDDSDEEHDLDEHRAEIAKKLRCRYRESCYETGELPDLEALTQEAAEALKRGPTKKDDDASDDGSADFNEHRAEIAKKHRCRYRESCYETGELPDLVALNAEAAQALKRGPSEKDDENSDEIGDFDEHRSEMAMKLRCRYRESCYETGELPNISALNTQANSALYSHPSEEVDNADFSEHRREYQRKLKCKYRISCFKEGTSSDEDETEESTPPPVKLDKEKPKKSKKKEKEVPPEPEVARRKKRGAEKKAEKKKLKEKEKIEEPKEKPDEHTESEEHLEEQAQEAEEEMEKPVALGKDEKEEEEEEVILQTTGDTEAKDEKEEEEVTPQTTEDTKAEDEAKDEEAEEEDREEEEDTTIKPASEEEQEELEGDREAVYQRKLDCKYRSTCYPTGELPDLEELRARAADAVSRGKQSSVSEDEDEDMSERAAEHRRKFACKYRTSCYQTGEVPDIGNLKALAAEAQRVSRTKTPSSEEDEIDWSERDEDYRKKMKCRYRTNCYETGELPDIEQLNSQANDAVSSGADKKAAAADDDDDFDLSERQEEQKHKLRCKYRKDCYETGDLPDIAHLKTLAAESEGSAPQKQDDEDLSEREEEYRTKLKCKYRSGCYETGELPNIAELKEAAAAAVGAGRSHHGKDEDEEDLSERAEEYRLRQKCKYRTSCYETGEVPDIEQLHMQAAEALGTTSQHKRKEQGSAEDDEDASERDQKYKQKLECKYRASCYETGELPDINELKAQADSSVSLGKSGTTEEDDDENRSERDAEYRKKQKCKYRTACYETGELPNIAELQAVAAAAVGSTPPKAEVASDEELSERDEHYHRKLSCKYRKDCYETGIKPDIQELNAAAAEALGQAPTDTTKETEEFDPGTQAAKFHCRYRLSCYDSGVLPDLKALAKLAGSVQHPPTPAEQKEDRKTDLKFKCKYKKSCLGEKPSEEKQEEDIEIKELKPDKEKKVKPDQKEKKKREKVEATKEEAQGAEEGADEEKVEELKVSEDAIEREKTEDEEGEGEQPQTKDEEEEKEGEGKQPETKEEDEGEEEEGESEPEQPEPEEPEPACDKPKDKFSKKCRGIIERREGAKLEAEKPVVPISPLNVPSEPFDLSKCSPNRYRHSCIPILEAEAAKREKYSEAPKTQGAQQPKPAPKWRKSYPEKASETSAESTEAPTDSAVPIDRLPGDQMIPADLFNDSEKCNRWRKSCREMLGIQTKGPIKDKTKQKLLCPKKKPPQKGAEKMKKIKSTTQSPSSTDNNQSEPLKR